MDDGVVLSLSEATALARAALTRVGVGADAAEATAAALVAAERDGQKGHGLSRVASYVEQVQSGKVAPGAVPTLKRITSAALAVDACGGFAYPAIGLAIANLVPVARQSGIGVVAIRRSHHFGQAGAHVEKLAEAGLVAMMLGNTPSAMAFWGGARPMMGTNPIAFAAPVDGAQPIVIDLALSVAARGKILAARKAGETIPLGWAFDETGAPTSDPEEALRGSIAPLGGAKGSALALMIEIFAAAVVGASFGFEASSFLDGKGGPPDMGQIIIACDPIRLSGGAYPARMQVLVSAMANEPGVRAPGRTRLENRQRNSAGLRINATLAAELRTLAGADA